MKLRSKHTTMIGAAALAAGALGQTPALAAEDAVAGKPDGAWIAISGEVATAKGQLFELDHGQGVITVEMEDWNSDMDAAEMAPGDKVTVYGFVDDGFYEERTIEASTVWNQRQNTFHFVSGADEEALHTVAVAHPAQTWTGPGVTVMGRVIDLDGRTLTLMTGEEDARELEVDTASMPYDPLDAEGAQIVTIGDRVAVSGSLDAAVFEDSEMKAESLMKLSGLRPPYEGG